jgi:hypothetical protein
MGMRDFREHIPDCKERLKAEAAAKAKRKAKAEAKRKALS